MGKESLLGIFLFFPLGNSAQIYYSYDFRGNLTFPDFCRHFFTL